MEGFVFMWFQLYLKIHAIFHKNWSLPPLDNNVNTLNLSTIFWYKAAAVFSDTEISMLSFCRAFISQLITGYLPSLILQLFLRLIPPVMIMLSSVQGYVAFSKIERSACIKVLLFSVWNIFFANVLSGSALYQVDVFLEPKKIPFVLAEAVPAQVQNSILQFDCS